LSEAADVGTTRAASSRAAAADAPIHDHAPRVAFRGSFKSTYEPPGPGASPMPSEDVPGGEGRAMVRGSGSGQPSGARPTFAVRPANGLEGVVRCGLAGGPTAARR
jgi:hypothetical protein